MRKKKHYTLILTSNTTQAVRKISLSLQTLKILFTVAIALFVGLVAFLTDYSGIAFDQWELKHLRTSNQVFKEELRQIKTKFAHLKKEVDQLQDFSHKIRLITTATERLSSYGKISSESSLMALSSPVISERNLASTSSQQKKGEEIQFAEMNDWTNREFSVHIERLKNKSKQMKEGVWNLYSSLLEKKEVLNNTPSIMPTRGWITSHFGYRNETLYVDHEPHFHRGMDIAASTGSPIFSTGEGHVTYTGYDEHGYGKLIIVDHGYNLKTYYAHLSQITVAPNTYVKRGQTIGYVGNTGRSTGPHLHYEIRVLGVPVDPMNYVLDGIDSLSLLSQ